ncbi:MAG: DegV family protein [Ruminococcaceae bacterium]|nr:DegV family protein [Oscillospiraceae bacterium]
MRNFVIVTDSCIDMTQEMVDSLGIKVAQLDIVIEGEGGSVANNEVDFKEVYRKLRDKKTISTSAVSIGRFTDIFDNILSEGENDILYLGFSSGLSSTYSSGKIALSDLQEKYPDRKLYAVDTLCASMGQGLLVYLACKVKESGATIEEVRDYVENNKLNLCHWFTVDDLFFLKRGGRVSAATAVLGTMLSIKPVLHVDNAGKLINVSKAKGRKASINAMFDKMKATMIPEKNSVVFISHGDCIEDAEYLANKIRTEIGIDHVEISYVGPVIGSHSGPGTLALFYLGTER